MSTADIKYDLHKCRNETATSLRMMTNLCLGSTINRGSDPAPDQLIVLQRMIREPFDE